MRSAQLTIIISYPTRATRIVYQNSRTVLNEWKKSKLIDTSRFRFRGLEFTMPTTYKIALTVEEIALWILLALLDYSVVQSSPCVRSRHASFAKRKRTEAIDNWIAGVDCFLVFGASRWREDDFTGQICCGCISLISATGFANVKKCMKNRLELFLRWSRKFHA